MIKRPFNWTAACFAAVVTIAAASAQTATLSATTQQDAGGDQAKIDQGKTTYAEKCSHCHGFNMVNPGTVAYDLRQFPHDQKSRFVSSVTNGKNGRMPQWGDVLSREEIDKLWAYVETGGSQ